MHLNYNCNLILHDFASEDSLPNSLSLRNELATMTVSYAPYFKA